MASWYNRNISLSFNNTQMDQQHTNVTRGASTDPLALPGYTPRQNFATSPKPNFSTENSSDDPNRVITTGRFSRPRLGQNRGEEER
jgi:hypothetical protein